jgi:hypothetical protein
MVDGWLLTEKTFCKVQEGSIMTLPVERKLIKEYAMKGDWPMRKAVKLPDPPQTPEERLEDILKVSGNNLHLRVAMVLKNSGWEVDLSSYYYDDTTEKPREIDIIAYKNTKVTTPLPMRDTTFRTSLFIDCKHFKEEIGFRMQPAVSGRKAMKAVGLNSSSGASEDRLYEHHHYAEEKSVGKLYDTVADSHLFTAITQPVKSLTFFRHQITRRGLYYPIVVYSGISGIYQLNSDMTSLSGLSPKNYSVFELNYSYRNLSSPAKTLHTETFFVEFVHEDEFPNLLRWLEQDVANFKELLKDDLMHS